MQRLAVIIWLLCACLSRAALAQESVSPEIRDLSFKEFFKLPAGPRGLEPTAKLTGLDGKRVRIAGYIVKQEQPSAGRFILAPMPVTLAEVADGPADDLPAAVLFVHLDAADSNHVVRFQTRPVILTGVLEIGAREEPNGRVSGVRLRLDPQAMSATRVAQ